MWRQRALATLILVLALILPTAVAADDRPAPTTRHQFRVDGLPLAGPAEMVRFVNEFQPGAQTLSHTHPGRTLITVLEGELTLHTPGGEKVYTVGESFIEGPDEAVTAVNTGGTRMRVTVSMVIPKGVATSTPQPGGPSPAPPGPLTRHLPRL